MILIYCHTITPRVVYTMDLVFNTVLNVEYRLTGDKNDFEKCKLPKLAYTTNLSFNRITILSHPILFETDITPLLPIADENYTDFPKFFTSSQNDFLGYDLFAMVFYFASRYEEYLESEKDKHQRFKAENSLAFKYNCLSIPFLNTAIHDFSIKLKREFPFLIFNKRTFNFLSTIDIDNAFAFAHKGFKRNAAGFFKDCVSLNFSKLISRVLSNFNDKKDPYHTFDLIYQLSTETKTSLQYFVLIGNYSAYDKNPNYKSKGFINLLKSLSNHYTLGLHPSYQAFNHLEKISIEQKRLENITEKKVNSARCHFLRVNLPETYREFIKHGITDDYTMIYASQSGFRTGLCMPYKWFDLQKNEATNLTIHTSVIMEGTLRDYNKLSAENAERTILNLLKEVKKYGGEFISIFHNDSFTSEQKEWIEIYKEIIIKSKL